MASRKMLLLQIYLYLICLVAAITFLIVAGNGLWGLVGVAWPKLTIDEHEYKIVASFEHFKHSRAETIREPSRFPPSETFDEGVLRRQWEDEKQLVLDTERRTGMREFVRMWVWMVIVVPIYFFHWRATRKLKEESETLPGTGGNVSAVQ